MRRPAPSQPGNKSYADAGENKSAWEGRDRGFYGRKVDGRMVLGDCVGRQKRTERRRFDRSHVLLKFFGL